jgi:predicted phage-related endonuclease
MAITECEVADLAVLIGNSDFRVYCIKRDLELEDLILEHAKRFWFDHVLGNTPPAPVNVQDVSLLFPKEAQGSSVEASDELIRCIQTYQDGCNRSQALSDECERLKLEILSFMGEAEKLIHSGKTLATWKCAKSSQRIDTKALAAAHPDIAKDFTSSVLGSRRFLLKGAV